MIVEKRLHWYVLFVKTGYEYKIVNEITKSWKIDGLNPFIPMYDYIFRRDGKDNKETRVLFPGYVFIETNIQGIDFYNTVKQYIVKSNAILSLLKYGYGYEDDHIYEMKENEQQVLRSLYSDSYCVEMSKGFVVGEVITITDGPLMGYESKIKKINRHRKEALVQIDFMGTPRDISVGLEIMRKL